MTNQITHTADLPFGYRVTFIWSEGSGVDVQWDPDVPCIQSSRAWRKFRGAYDTARRSFYTDLATYLDGAVLSVDIDGAMEAVRPASRH